VGTGDLSPQSDKQYLLEVGKDYWKLVKIVGTWFVL